MLPVILSIYHSKYYITFIFSLFLFFFNLLLIFDFFFILFLILSFCLFFLFLIFICVLVFNFLIFLFLNILLFIGIYKLRRLIMLRIIPIIVEKCRQEFLKWLIVRFIRRNCHANHNHKESSWWSTYIVIHLKNSNWIFILEILIKWRNQVSS